MTYFERKFNINLTKEYKNFTSRRIVKKTMRLLNIIK